PPSLVVARAWPRQPCRTVRRRAHASGREQRPAAHRTAAAADPVDSSAVRGYAFHVKPGAVSVGGLWRRWKRRIAGPCSPPPAALAPSRRRPERRAYDCPRRAVPREQEGGDAWLTVSSAAQ